ncbi:MAG: Rrf2 family transcriptional regulator [Saprospiraceae bacterium]
MKLSASDEYGIRILLRIARAGQEDGLTTADLAGFENISMSHAGKVLRLLRQGGYVESTRGNQGGYMLTRKPEEINIGKVLATLGGRLFDTSFCAGHSAGEKLCTNSVDCSVRSLWSMVQYNVDQLLAGVSLADLIGTEEESALLLKGKVLEES